MLQVFHVLLKELNYGNTFSLVTSVCLLISSYKYSDIAQTRGYRLLSAFFANNWDLYCHKLLGEKIFGFKMSLLVIAGM